MRNEEIKAELSALRAEVVALAEARKQASLEPSSAGMVSAPVEESREAQVQHEGLKGQLQELVELLEQELKDTPVVSGLVIFSLGILVGRFMR
jgi:hypothetical protein